MPAMLRLAEIVPALEGLTGPSKEHGGATVSPAGFVALASSLNLNQGCDSALAARFVAQAVRFNAGTPTEAALNRLGTFLRIGGGLLGFPRLQRDWIACEAALRLVQPSLVAQLTTETCGPAAFIIDLCRRSPLEYVRVLIELAAIGKSKIQDLDLTPTDDIRNRESGMQIHGMAHADWVMLASLRSMLSTTNGFRAIELLKGGGPENSGVNPGAIYDWLCKSGYASVCLIGEDTVLDALRGKADTHKVYADPKMGSLIQGRFKKLDGQIEGALRFIASVCKADGWACFLFVKSNLDTALKGGTKAAKDAQSARLTLQHSPLAPNPADNSLMRPQYTDKAKETFDRAAPKAKLAMKEAAQALKGTDAAGHVMLLHDIEIGGFYVSCTVSNRGQLMYHPQMPAKDFFSNIRSVVMATDRRI
jgi:hypothetical protein